MVASCRLACGLVALGLAAGCQRAASGGQGADGASPEAPPAVAVGASAVAGAGPVVAGAGGVVVAVASGAGAVPGVRGLRAGDLVFQTSRSEQSRAVQAATRSALSHMGLVLPGRQGLVVHEAVGPVKVTPVDEWRARGVDGRILVKRLRRPDGGLTGAEIGRLAAAAEAHLGKPYDALFGWSDERLYCSELVWKVYRDALGLELHALERLGDFDLTHPDVAAPLRRRYGGVVPRDEPVISPAAIAASALLETVEVP